MISLGVVGTSAITHKFLSGANLTNAFAVTAVYSRSQETGEAFAKEEGIPHVFTSLEEMASSPLIDAVYIASPNGLHPRQTRVFLDGGKHVICEKALVTAKEEYVALKALADQKGLIYMDAISPRHVKAREAVHSALARIGKIKEAHLTFCQRSSRLDDYLAGMPINIFDMSLHAGCLMDIGIYCVWVAVDLLGMPLTLTASADYLKGNADTSGVAYLTYPDFPCTLTYSKVENQDTPSIIVGEKGTLSLSSISQYLGVTLTLENGEEEIAAYPSRAEVMSGEAKQFANFILNTDVWADEYAHLSEQTLMVYTLMDQIKESAGIHYPADRSET